MDTLHSISSIINHTICEEDIYDEYLQRLQDGLLTRDENPQSHFCTYFLPYNKDNKKVLMVHHKKSGLWLSPGGHIDKGETVVEALNREIDEELGVKDFYDIDPTPFLLTITPIENQSQPCKKHYDIWYLVETDGSNFNINPTEFLDTKWLTIDEARKIVTEPQNIKALNILEKL